MLAIYIGVQMFMMTYRYLDGVKNGKVIKKKKAYGLVVDSYIVQLKNDPRH